MKTPKWAMWLSLVGAAMSIVGLLLVHADRSSGPSPVSGDTSLSDPLVSDPYAPDPAVAEPAPVATEAPFSSADDLKPHDKGWALRAPRRRLRRDQHGRADQERSPDRADGSLLPDAPAW